METMEFAVIQTGGKQYKVSAGDTIQIEKLTGDFKVGDKITFGEVLLSDNGKDTTFGAPFISGGKVMGTLESIGRAQKVMVVKYKQKSRYFKSNGHRQHYFKVKIDSIK
jgi:large subunit ribosomal protein L21